MLLELTPIGKGRGKHGHVAYVSPVTGLIEVSTDAGHTHVVTAQQSQDGGGVEFIVEDTIGHTHAVVPVVKSSGAELKDEDPKDVVARKIAQFDEAYDYEGESIAKGQESIRFREGVQWDEEQVRQLSEQKRAALTINQIAPMIETLSGVYRQTRTDIKFFPIEDGDARVADILTLLVKGILSQNNFEHEEVDVFEDGISAGRGLVEIYPTYDTNIEGDIKIGRFPWDMVLFGPHIKKDGTDAEVMFKWSWLSRDELVSLFPDKEDVIDNVISGYDNLSARAHRDLSGLDSPSGTSGAESGGKSKKYRLIECEEKEYRRVSVFFDPESDFVVLSNEVDERLKKSLKTIPSLVERERRIHLMRVTTILGNEILEDYYDTDRPVRSLATGPDFSIIPFYAYKRGPVFEGKIERAKDPQREINKRRSQIVDIVNTSINNGWISEEGTFRSKAEEKKFLETVSTAGFHLKVPDIKKAPIKIESGVVQPGIVQLELASLQSFRETTNVSNEMYGRTERRESGVALLHKRNQSLTGSEYLFDNMRLTKKLIGRTLLGWIKKLYSPKRIARIVMSEAQRQAARSGDQQEHMKIGGQPVIPGDIETMLAIERIVSEADLDKYDVEVGEGGMSATTMLANFEILLDAAGKGIPIPPEVLISMSPLPEKTKILESIQRQQQAAAEAKMAETNAEISKTLIAKGIDPRTGQAISAAR